MADESLVSIYENGGRGMMIEPTYLPTYLALAHQWYSSWHGIEEQPCATVVFKSEGTLIIRH